LSSLKYFQAGRYAVLKKLGEGGKGVVYKVRDTILNRVVAIKMLKGAVLSSEAYSRFIREAQAVAKLNHPNIVSIYDIGKEDGKQFFVLEFVDGMSLRELMGTYPEGRCDIQTVLRIGIDICNALKYAHSQGVLHRDIKPENILITQEDVAKLMDFGLAKMLEQPSITQDGIIVGTVAYVAPEIALGKGADVRSDLYSFGVVLYEMVTGKPPFPGEDPVKIIFSHIHDYPVSPIKLNEKIPPALSECIMRLLEKEPEKRCQTAADLLKVLREIAEGFLREVLVSSSHKPSVVVPSYRPYVVREVHLINRVEEMQVLREAVDRALRGEGGVVFLYGEAGIGKTRLARELGTYARLRGMQVLYGRCPALFRMDGVPPYILWKEVIKDYLENCDPKQLYRIIGFYPSEVSKLVPELKQKLGTIPMSLPISPAQERDRLFEAVSQFVTNISKEAPLLVVLDDLQWADQSSLLLTHYLARGIYKEQLLVLGAYRDTYVDESHPLYAVLTELNRERLLQSIPLKRLSFADVIEMIKQILEQDDVSRDFCKLIYEKTRGNPFFIEEVIKSLKEEKIIYREDDKWNVEKVSKIEFPKTVKNVIKKRLSRLDDKCQQLLTMASFVGKDFSFEAILGITGLEEDELLELMEKILKTGLVKEKVVRGEDVYSFADIIVRDVIHEEVSHLRHKKLHNSVGEALEKVYSENIHEHFGELAYHFLEGGNYDKALEYFLKAGEKAHGTYAYDEAFSYLQHALMILEEKEAAPKQKVHVIEKLGDLKGIMGDHKACMGYWDKALALWNQMKDKKNIARLHAKMASALWGVAGDREKASQHHRIALEILEKEPESVELADLYEDISHMLWRTGASREEAWSWAQKAFKLAKKLDANEILANCYNDLGTLSIKSGEVEKAVEYYKRGLKIAIENKDVGAATQLYNNLCEVYLNTGQFQEGFTIAQEGLKFDEKTGNLYGIAWIKLMLAYYAFNMGDPPKAISLVHEVITLDKKIGYTSHLPYAMLALGFAYHWLGEWDKSLQLLTDAFELAKKVGEYQFAGSAALGLGELYMDMGKYAKAEQFLKEGNNIVEKAGDKAAQIRDSFPALVKLYLQIGKIEEAENLIAKIYEHATRARAKLIQAHVEMLKGMLFREQKVWKQSVQHFEKSLKIYENLNAQKWYLPRLAELLYEYGLMYLKRNKKGDKEKAYSLLNKALEIYQKIGAKKKIEEIIGKKRLLTA
jgi:tetratricopeptide (TPR) repeat protein